MQMKKVVLVFGLCFPLTLVVLYSQQLWGNPFKTRLSSHLQSYLVAPEPIHVELNHEISTAPIVALPLKGKSIIFGKTREALDQCRATVHALGGGLCEVAGFGTLYPNQGVPSQPQDALICITGKTCP